MRKKKLVVRILSFMLSVLMVFSVINFSPLFTLTAKAAALGNPIDNPNISWDSLINSYINGHWDVNGNTSYGQLNCSSFVSQVVSYCMANDGDPSTNWTPQGTDYFVWHPQTGGPYGSGFAANLLNSRDWYQVGTFNLPAQTSTVEIMQGDVLCVMGSGGIEYSHAMIAGDGGVYWSTGTANSKVKKMTFSAIQNGWGAENVNKTGNSGVILRNSSLAAPPPANSVATLVGFTKCDANGNGALEGATFTVYDIYGNAISRTKAANEDMSAYGFSGDDLNGWAIGPICQNGNYYFILCGDIGTTYFIKETGAPTGYTIPTDYYKVVTLTYESAFDVGCAGAAAGDGSVVGGEVYEYLNSHSFSTAAIYGDDMLYDVNAEAGWSKYYWYEAGIPYGEAAVVINKSDEFTGNLITATAEFGVFADAACTTPVTQTISQTPGEEGTAYSAEIKNLKDGSGNSILGRYGVILKGLPDDTYYIKETKAPTGYEINPTVYTITLSQDLPVYAIGGTSEQIIGYMTTGSDDEISTFASGSAVKLNDTPKYITLKVTKDDEETFAAIQNNATFIVEAKNGTLSVPVTFTKKDTANADSCYYESSPIYYNESNGGKFLLYEAQAPTGYYGDWLNMPTTNGAKLGKVIHEFSLDPNAITGASIPVNIINKEQKYQVGVRKTDSITGHNINMKGFVYGLYAQADINYPDGYRGVAYHAGDLVSVGATDNNGELIFDDLYPGSYYIQEMYVMDETDTYYFAFYLDNYYSGDLMHHVWNNTTKTLDEVDNPIWSTFTSIMTSDGAGGFLHDSSFTQYQMYYADLNQYSAVSVPSSDETVWTITGGYKDSEDLPIWFTFRIYKDDSETFEAIQNDAVFMAEYADGTPLAYGVTFTKYDTSDPALCYYESSPIYYTNEHENKYVLYEQLAPTGYYGDWDDKPDPGVPNTKPKKKLYEHEIVSYTQAMEKVDVPIVNDEVKGEIALSKKDIEADAFIADGENGDASLVGLVFGLYAKNDILYPDGYRGTAFSADSLVEIGSTDENGNLVFDNLYLGEYYIKEMYILSDAGDKHLGFSVLDADGNKVLGSNLMSYDWDGTALTQNYNPYFEQFLNSGIYTADGNGGFVHSDMTKKYAGLKFNGYHADDTTHDVTVQYDTEAVPVIYDSAESYNQVIKGKVSFTKYETSEVSNVYNALEGAGFTLYRIEALSKYDTAWVKADGTINEGLIRNAYMVNDAGAYYDDNGYLIQKPIYNFSAEDAAKITFYAYNSPNGSVTFVDDGSGTSLTGFYWDELQTDIASGKVTSLGGNKYQVNELFSDDYGLVTTPYIPFGEYVVVETTTPVDHEQVMPFVLKCYDNRTVISSGISEDTTLGATYANGHTSPGDPYESWYHYSNVVLDKIVNMRVFLSKFDAATGKKILNPGAVYRIYGVERISHNGVTITSEAEWEDYKTSHPELTFNTKNVPYSDGTSRDVEYWTEINGYGYPIEYELRIIGGEYVRSRVIKNEIDEELDDTFITSGIYQNGIMTDCYFETQQLAVGDYLVEEESAPEGYYNDHSYNLTFKITTERVYAVEIILSTQLGRNYTVEEKYYDPETYGIVTVQKKGSVLVGADASSLSSDIATAAGTNTEYTLKYNLSDVGGAKYKIVANEDIITPDHQTFINANGEVERTSWFKKGDVVCVFDTALLNQNTNEAVIYDGSSPRVEITDDGMGGYNASYYGMSTGYYNTFASHPIVKIGCDTEGFATVSLPLGSYTISEIEVPFGLELSKETYSLLFKPSTKNEAYVINVSEPQSKTDITVSGNTLTYTDKRAKVSLYALKHTKEEDKPYANVLYGLYTNSAIYDYHGNEIVPAGSLISHEKTDANGKALLADDICLGYYNTDASSHYSVAENYVLVDKTGYAVEHNNEGNYYVKELSVPYGIYIDKTPKYVSYHVYDNGLKHYYADTIYDGNISDGDSATVLFLNDSTKVLISKQDVNNGNELAGATFVVRDNETMDGVATILSTGSVTPYYNLKSLDTLPATKDAPGTYMLKEISSPSGYNINPDEFFFVLINNYNELGEPLNTNDIYVWKKFYKTESAIVDSGVYDSKLEWRVNSFGELEIKSVTNYTFPVRPDGLTLPWEAYEIKAVMLSDTIYFASLPDGTLCSKQYFSNLSGDKFRTERDTNVILEDWVKSSAIVVTDSPSGNPAPPKGTVKVSKKLLTGENELTGAKFAIYDENGTMIDFWTTTEQPHYCYNLVAGAAYRLVELSAPIGYSAAKDIPFTVTSDGLITQVTAVDEYSEVKIYKIDPSGKQLAGATLTIIDKQTGTVIDTWVTDGTPHVLTAILSSDKEYVLSEIKTPEGYRKASNITFKLAKGETTVIKMKDSPEVTTDDIYDTKLIFIGFGLELIVLVVAFIIFRKKMKKQ